MAEFKAPVEDGFDHRAALVEMLNFLAQVLTEVWRDSRWLLPARFREEPVALMIARDQIGLLIAAVWASELSPARWDDYGLRGEALRFKLQVIEIANAQSQRLRSLVLERETDGRTRRTWWPFRRAVRQTLAAVDGPLESLTKLLGVHEGVVEFKKGVEVLLGVVD